MTDKSIGQQRAAENKDDQNEKGEEAQPKGHPTSDRYHAETAHAKPGETGAKPAKPK